MIKFSIVIDGGTLDCGGNTIHFSGDDVGIALENGGSLFNCKVEYVGMSDPDCVYTYYEFATVSAIKSATKDKLD